MDEPKAIRAYRDTSDKNPFQSLVNSLSFALRNMAASQPPGSINTLSREIPEGKVTVTRVGSMRGESHGMEFVKIEPSLAEDIIILTADSSHTFIIPIKSLSLGTMKKAALGTITHHDQTYQDPDYDKTLETCIGLFTTTERSFQSIDTTENAFRASTRETDWHNNYFRMNGFIPAGDDKSLRKYYDIGTPIPLTADNTWVNFSFSPYTYAAHQYHISRYIDHTKRTFRPYYRAEDLPSTLQFMADFTDLPYGKRPFTRDSDNAIVTSKEVVIPGSIVMSEILLPRVLWPFVPYLHEIPYLNLLYYSKWSDTILGGTFDSDLAASITNFSIQHSGGTSAIRDSSGSLNIGSESINTTEDPTPYLQWYGDYLTPVQVGSACGTWNTVTEITQQWSAAIGKSETVGTVGNLQDLHITHSISVSGNRASNDRSTVTKTTSFPAAYYLWWSGLGEEDLLPVGTYSDTSTGDRLYTDRYTGSISISSALKVGDVTIEEGESTLSYSSSISDTIGHQSNITLVVEGGASACTLQYTTLLMQPGEEQEFSATGAQAPFLWKLSGTNPGKIKGASGVESLEVYGEASITYVAPASNAGCDSEPTLILFVGANEGCDNSAGMQVVYDATQGYKVNQVPGTGAYEECGRVDLVISTFSDLGVDAYQVWGEKSCTGIQGGCGEGSYAIGNGYISVDRYNCIGALISSCNVAFQVSIIPACDSSICENSVYTDTSWAQCSESGRSLNVLSNTCDDLRTAFMINYGCCVECPV